MIRINGFTDAVNKVYAMPKVNGADPVTLLKAASLPLQTALAKEFKLGEVRLIEEDEIEEYGALGLPVYGSLTLEELEYKTDRKRKVLDLHIPAVVVEASIPKVVEKTKIQSSKRRGTFKEYICEDDVQITVKGVLSDDNFKHPTRKVKHLREFANVNKRIGVTNNFLNAIGVFDIVIEDLRWLATPGKTNMQFFEITAVSDEAMELEYYQKLALNGNAL